MMHGTTNIKYTICVTTIDVNGRKGKRWTTQMLGRAFEMKATPAVSGYI
jgi:hypothetical protein